MGSKAFVFLLLLWALLLFISSDVAARDYRKHVEAGSKTNEIPPGSNEYTEPGYGSGNGRCRYGCCSRDYAGRCWSCCPHAGETVEAQTEAKPHN